MKRAARVDDLFMELRNLVEEGTRVIRAAPERPRPSPALRLGSLQRALAKGDLVKVRLLVPDRRGNAAQRAVVHVHACILETNSGGLSMLRDRFSARERRSIAEGLRAIGATRTRAALLRLEQRKASTREPADALVREMEQKLLAFCRAHVAALAA